MFQGMEYVYEVYKEKSFSKAAANLFISQPSLSANVKRVENRIGYPIFDTSAVWKKSWAFTEAFPPLYMTGISCPPEILLLAEAISFPPGFCPL